MDTGEALGVAVLGFATPIWRHPNSGTGIRNIQFFLLELCLWFLIQWVHQVNLPRTDVLLSHIPTASIFHLLVLCFVLQVAPMGSSLTTKIQKCSSATSYCVTRSGPCVSIQRDGGGFSSPSHCLEPQERGPVREEALQSIPFASFSCWVALASHPSCQAAWNLPRDSCTAQETLVLNLASQIPFWG